MSERRIIGGAFGRTSETLLDGIAADRSRAASRHVSAQRAFDDKIVATAKANKIYIDLRVGSLDQRVADAVFTAFPDVPVRDRRSVHRHIELAIQAALNTIGLTAADVAKSGAIRNGRYVAREALRQARTELHEQRPHRRADGAKLVYTA